MTSKKNKQKTKNKIAGLSPNISKITLNINAPNIYIYKIIKVQHGRLKTMIQECAIYKKFPSNMTEAG